MYDINQVCRVALDLDASDIHITAASPPVFRIRSELRIAKIEALSGSEIRKVIYGLLTKEQILEFEERKGLEFTLLIDDKHRFRANAYMQRGHMSVALRPIAGQVPGITELGLPPVLKKLALAPAGLVLITGPTGHGKSTTQAAMTGYINTEKRCHIITIEDPIEFLHQNDKSIIEQREVGMDVPSFHEALRTILRQDPDVVMVGEMRDLETIESTLRAAETGHLVIANLHANDAVGSIERLLHFVPGAQQGPVRVQLSLTLNAVIGQRLLPRQNGTGRVPAVEILVANDAVRHLIRDNKVHQIYTVMQTGSKEGTITLDMAVRNLYRAGIVTFDIAKNFVKNPSAMKQ
ncbi:type IV pilus twitching motility protein PilT [Planctomycetota bacterium]